MITTELGLEVEETRKAEQPEAWALDHEAYANELDTSLKERYQAEPSRENAAALAMNYIYAMFKTLKPGAGVVLNSSTGKDSTLLTALYFEAALGWQAQGHDVPRTVVAMADTAAEFPLMANRIGNEVDRINAYAQSNELPISAIVERAKPKNRLFAEIIGNGRPLPALASGAAKNASGSANTNWCMDRVKGGPLEAINKRIQLENPFFIQMIGVRYGESSTRDTRIAKYSEGLADGLTRVGGITSGEDVRLGILPIVDWTTELVEDFLRNGETPWNYAAPFELGKIYYSASSKSDQNATQCDLTLTQEGTISNKCEGFDGARLGCWCCVKSVNKSLRNMHRNDSRALKEAGKASHRAAHRWLRGFHKYLIGLHSRYENATSKNLVRGRLSGESVKVPSIVKAMGKDTNVLFCKNINFEERARLLLLLFRAELESGFKLIDQAELDQIAVYWKKAGVYHVHPEEIRKDARRWKKTGKPVLSYKSVAAHMDRTDIAEGIAGGAFFHLDQKAKDSNFQALKMLHLLPLRSNGTPLLPIPRAYIFERRERSNNDSMVMVTDMPSVLGAKTNTNLLNGIAPFAWVVRGTRELTEWEWAMFKAGRNFFYSHLSEETDQAIGEYLAHDGRHQEGRSYGELRRDGAISAAHGFFPHTNPVKLQSTNMRDTIIRNVGAVRHCGFDREVMDDQFTLSESIAELAGRVTTDDLMQFHDWIGELADIADWMEMEADELARNLESLIGDKWAMLEEVRESDSTEAERKAFHSGLLDLGKRSQLINRTHEQFLRHQEILGKVLDEVKAGNLNAALIGKMAYITRTQRYDPEYAAELSLGLMKTLCLLPANRSVAA